MISFGSIGRVLLGMFFGVALAMVSLAFDADMHRDVVNTVVTLYEDAVMIDLAAGDCWTTGDHGYPTRMWTVETDENGSYFMQWRSQKNVDLAVLQVFNGHDNGYNVVAFCDGIDLATGEPTP